MTNEGQYPRWLNGHGCLFGQGLSRRFDTWKDELKEELKEDYKDRMDRLEKKLDWLIITAVGVAISLMTASLTIWINYIGK